MLSTDFEYDGQYLSDYGFIVCDFDYSSGVVIANAGSKITFNKVPFNRGKNFSLTSTRYDECISATFDICKNPDMYELNGREISSDEYKQLMRWLNRKEFLRFKVITDIDEYNNCYYDVSFNISKIKIREKLYGLRLQMESNKPFGYEKEKTFHFALNGSNTPSILYDSSDEIGYIYPTVIITCKENGDLSLYNKLEDCTTIIKNCSVGEVITLNGDVQIISTTYNSHDICNDFNYEFFKIGNTINDRDNKISASKACDVVIKYNPIVKSAP